VEGVQDTLSRAGIFQGVDPVAVQNLLEQMETVRFPRGTTIFDEGEPGDRLYIITSGKIKLARHAPDGRENLLTVMGPSDMFGELSIFDPGPRTSSAVCVTEVQAATMNSELLDKWVSDHPAIAQQLLRVLARRLRRTNANLADLIFTEALYSPEDFEKFRAAVDTPLLANMTEFGKTELQSAKTLDGLGYNAVIWPVSSFRVAMGATEEFLRDLQDTGIQTEWLERMQHRSRLYELVRYQEYNEFDQSVFTYSKDSYQPIFES